MRSTDRLKMLLLLASVLRHANLSASTLTAHSAPLSDSTHAEYRVDDSGEVLPGPDSRIDLQVGHTVVLSANGVSRVAVGNGEVVEAMVLDAREVMVFGRTPGSSSLHVWAKGKRLDFDVQVQAEESRRMQQELQALLRRIPGAGSRIVGGKFVIDGQGLSDSDRARITALAARYPDIIDFTGTVGWDRMVMFDVRVVEIPSTRLSELGIRWNGASDGGIHAGVSWDAAGGRDVLKGAGDTPIDRPGTRAGAAGYLGINALLSSRLHAMAESGEAVILAQPQLLARSGATADFLAGGEVPYTTVDSSGKASTQFKPYGVSLKMTPRLEAGDVIRAHISVEASAVDPTISGESGPALKTRRASTEFNVVSGRTLVLAGFLSHESSQARQGLPGLQDIPWLGSLFGTRRKMRRDVELAIFVTPTIVNDEHPALRARIERAEGFVREARPDEPRMNIPLHAPSHVSDSPVPVVDEDIFSGQWDQNDNNLGTEIP